METTSYLGYEITITEATEHYVKMDVYERWQPENRFLLTSHIKWDGCSHFDYKKDTHVHVCGMDGFQEYFLLHQFLFNKSMELMNREIHLELFE